MAGPTPTFLFTVDADWVPGSEPGYERLLELAEEYDLPVTLFATGKFAQDAPDLVRETDRRDGDVGAHGWAHGLDLEENYRTMTRDRQRRLLERTTDSLEQVVGRRPALFRAPYLQISPSMLAVLEELDYRIDSSVPARRYDALWGSVQRLRHFAAPVTPYRPDRRRLSRPGESALIEIPPSAFLLPVIMTAIRRIGLQPTTWAARRALAASGIINFYCHPWEFVEPHRRPFPEGAADHCMERCGPDQLDVLRRFVETMLEWGCEPRRMTDLVRT